MWRIDRKMNIRDEIQKLRKKEEIKRIDDGEYLINGIWYKSKKEYDRIIKSEFAKLDKNSNDYPSQLECKRSFYGIRKKDLNHYIS